MKKIHFHSDCNFFAGSEKMLINFFESKELKQNFELTFSFRKNKHYEKEFKLNYSGDVRYFPLKLIDYHYFLKFTKIIKFKIIKYIYVIILELTALKFFIIGINTFKFLLFFRKNRPDILHINNGGYPGAYSSYSAIFAAKILKINKIIYIINNVPIDYKNPLRISDFIFDKVVKMSVNIFVSGSDYVKSKITDVLKVKEQKVIKINNGIKVKKISESSIEFKIRNNIKFDSILIGIVAVLEKRKGHILLLDAFKRIKEKYVIDKDITLIIEGHGSQKSVIQEYIYKNNLSRSVIMIDKEENIQNLLNALDILILPSISYEDFPNITLEAMNLGKIVIASDFGGIKEQIIDGEDGFLFKSGDIEDLVFKIMSVIENIKMMHVVGKKASEKIQNLYLNDIAVKKYIDLYKELT
jgi:glycosyltransferase involved in cell wall biosynthesis